MKGHVLPGSASAVLPAVSRVRSPFLSLVLQYFRHPDNVLDIVRRVEVCRAELPFGLELLANVDSHDPADVAAWLNVTAPWVTPVLSSNLHEIRAYNRVGGMARGSILVFLQDDDIPPDSCDWLVDLVTVFDAWPTLGIVGMKVGVYKEGHARWPESRIHFQTRWPRTGPGPGPGPGEEGSAPDVRRSPDTTPTPTPTPIRFQFVSWVDFAPFAVRRTAFERLGGLDESFSGRGESGIYSDVDLCYRAWTAGWRVGHMAGGRGHRKGAAWTTETTWGQASRSASEKRNYETIVGRHGSGYAFSVLHELIQRLNTDELDPIRPGRWTFGGDFVFDGEELPN